MAGSRRREKPAGRDNAALLTAVAAFLTGLIGAVPVIRDFLPKDPTVKRVVIRDIQPELGWLYREFLSETKRELSEGSLDEDWADWPGAEVTFNVTIVGYKEKRLRAIGWVVNAETGERMKAFYHASEGRRLDPQTETFAVNPSIWVALPKEKGRYRITVGIFEGGARLARRQSPIVTVR